MVKKLFENKWIDLYETKRGFVFAQRRTINSTACLLFKQDGKDYKFLLRYQPLPELKITEKNKLTWNKLYPCCVTGSIEANETPTDNAIKEILEETNYVTTKNNIKASSISVASTQMNESVFNFVVDITNAKQVYKKTGDGSIFENISRNRWVSHKKLKEILTTNKFVYLSSLSSAYVLFTKVILHK
ncbi:MAG: NUDIX domain-containing protein [Mycoplasmataceae bacterium]|nr:NUDIX domain-containing protein [Mycoplasmataceae bacterium]